MIDTKKGVIKLKEIPFGTPIDDPDGYCIYANGHVDASEFLAAVKSMAASDVPEDVRAELTVADVEYCRFRPMSPTEARGHGIDWGVVQTDTAGRPVTAVKV